MGKGTAGFIIATGYDSEGQSVNPISWLGDSSIIRRQVVNMQLAGVSPIVVLSGCDNLRVEHHLDCYGVVFFQMQDFQHIQLKQDVLPVLSYLQDKCERIIYAPVEYPLLKTETIRRLTETKGDICYPEYQGQRGYPTILDKSIITKIHVEDLEKYEILEDYLDDQPLMSVAIPVDDEGVICNIADTSICERLIKKHNYQMQHPYIHLDIDYDTKIFDERLGLLLSMIHETKSVKRACMRVSMSVGKAWSYSNLLEEKLQYPVVDRRQGGKRGGGTDLTKEGLEYLEKYLELEQNVQKYAQKEYERIFVNSSC